MATRIPDADVVAAALPLHEPASTPRIDGIDVFRGVPRSSPAHADALRGIARPRGGSATPEQHNAGDTRSKYTSWTTEKWIAEDRAAPGGVVLRVNLRDYASRWCETPDIFGEREILIEGAVFEAEVI